MQLKIKNDSKPIWYSILEFQVVGTLNVKFNGAIDLKPKSWKADMWKFYLMEIDKCLFNPASTSFFSVIISTSCLSLSSLVM